MMTLGRCIDKIKTSRCGIIPYCIRPLVTSSGYRLDFLVSKHRPSGQLGDFGGGVKKDEYALHAGNREFIEESKGIFQECVDINTLSSSICFIIENDMAIIFVNVGPEWYDLAPQRFLNAKLEGKTNNEVSEVVWVSESELTELVFPRSSGVHESDSNVMWKRVKIFLQKIMRSRPGFYQFLKNKSMNDPLLWSGPLERSVSESVALRGSPNRGSGVSSVTTVPGRC